MNAEMQKIVDDVRDGSDQLVNLSNENVLIAEEISERMGALNELLREGIKDDADLLKQFDVVRPFFSLHVENFRMRKSCV